jgi:hypothetical protein
LAHVLMILIVSQLDHFGFATVSSPQTAGVACSLTVYAYDAGNNIYPFTGPASLFASPGPQYGNQQVNFNNGVWQGLFTAYLADTYAIRCQDYSSPPHTGQSNQIIFNPNTPYRLLTIMPGQTYTPGIDTGKSGTAISQQAGTDFATAVYLTDHWCNRIPGTSDSVVGTNTDNFKSALYFRLSDGAFSFNYSFRTATNQRFFMRDASVPAMKSDTSSQIYIYPGAYAWPLVLLPGETHVPGDTTSVIASTPGKAGGAMAQFVDDSFTVRVYAVDTMWNKTPNADGHTVHLVSNFPFSYPADQQYSNGIAQFSVSYTTIGANQDLYAQDLSTGAASYVNRLDIVAKTDSIYIVVAPDTVAAGDTARITATLYDRNGDAIPHRPVSFSVLAGHGEIPVFYDSTYTNDLGTCYSYFTCGAGFFDELDTIGVTADGAIFKAPCFVRFPDSTVMEGNIIAYPNPIGIRADHTRLIYYLNRNCDITYAIYDPFGNMVHRENIVSGQPGAHMGVNYLTWNGRNDKGVRVASGLYYVMLKGYVNTSVFLEKKLKVGVIW